MTRALPTARRRSLALIVLPCLLAAAPAALAQTHTVTYVLENVWLDPDITHPWLPPEPMTGSFQWTYVQGDFENGAGTVLDLTLPWFNPPLSELNTIIDLTSIEITFPGNFHDLGVDITLRLLEPLAPGQPSTIDTVLSAFEIQNGVIYQGHVISGSVVPVAAPCPADFTGDGAVDVSDLLGLLAEWGPCPAGCVTDLNADGEVDVSDLLDLLSQWGPC